jgi:hypothetical protein
VSLWTKRISPRRFAKYRSIPYAPVSSAARDWRWSNVQAQLGERDDGVTTPAPVRERYPDFVVFLSEESALN